MLLSILLLSCFNIQILFADPTIIFQSGESGYNCVRIPSLFTTAKGTLLAFGEGRKYSCADATEKDIIYKRSTDNGQTWSELKILCQGNLTDDGYNRVGNFAPVQLKYNQRILVPFTRNDIIIMQSFSDDDGLTFSPAQVIPNVTQPDWKIVALGPPSGILLQSNRILIPANRPMNSSLSGFYSLGYVMLNDHDGQIDKWYLGGEYSLDGFFPNEAQAVELLPKANSIFINARSLKTVRIGAYSNDGGLTFNKVNVLKTLVQPPYGCEGSTIYHPNSGRLFYTGLANTTVRTNLSLYISNDESENWTYTRSIWPGPSAYSSMATLNDQSVAVLFEGGNQTSVDFIMYSVICNATQ